MFRNYAVTSLRNLRKHFGYTSINLIGLTLGLTVTLQIFLFVQSELSYDRFHKDAEDLYRITLDGSFSGTILNAPISPAPMANALVNDFPDVVAATRLYTFRGERMVRKGATEFLEDGIILADSTFFDVLTFPLLQGNPETALARPSTVVLTQTIALKLFGSSDPMGETIILADSTVFEVTGIVADPPQNSHIQFTILESMTGFQQAESDFWVSNNFFTYLKLQKGSTADGFEAKLPAWYKQYAGPQIEAAFGKSYDEILTGQNYLRYHLQPMLDVHLRSNFTIDNQVPGDIAYVYLFIAVAFFILLLACINFMNLATARSAVRATEVGIRKIVGSSRNQLIGQFLSESILMAVFAMIFAVGLVFVTTPIFNSMTGLNVNASFLLRPGILAVLALGALTVGILAGSYPAFFLSSFKPVSVIKGRSSMTQSSPRLRNALVVFQFGISVALLIGTFVVNDQLSFIQNKRLGFIKENVILIENAGKLRDQSDAFKNSLRELTSIIAVGGTTAIPGSLHGADPLIPEGFEREDFILTSPVMVDYDYIEAMGIELAMGRAFSRDFPSDSAAIILNEAALAKIGWDDPLGKLVYEFGGTDGQQISKEVVGIVRDYHFKSMREEIGSLSLKLGTRPMPTLVVRTDGKNTAETLRFIEQEWDAIVPDQPLNYSFLDEKFDLLYSSDQRLGRVFSSFALFAIVIAGLGLFGLGMFVTEQRTKEIGLRKAMGASVSQIVIMLSRDFTRLVLLAIVLAVPLAWYGMNEWLDGFVYRTELQFGSFLLAAAIALAIALLTVTVQSIKAAMSDPIKALNHN